MFAETEGNMQNSPLTYMYRGWTPLLIPFIGFPILLFYRTPFYIKLKWFDEYGKPFKKYANRAHFF